MTQSTGPDHLSAIAALAANTSYVHSISYGMRWVRTGILPIQSTSAPAKLEKSY